MFRGSGVQVFGYSGVRVFRTGKVNGATDLVDHERLIARTPERRSRFRSGFTLIEVMVVMIILAILAAVVVPRVVGREEDARRARALSDVESLGTALDLYKADNGDYPTTEEGLPALRTAPATAKNWNGPYLKKALAPDPWGHDYIYSAPGEHNPDSYDLYSTGKDGQPGGEGNDKDITNWDETQK
jgi:general secretion pathway protein G